MLGEGEGWVGLGGLAAWQFKVQGAGAGFDAKQVAGCIGIQGLRVHVVCGLGFRGFGFRV